MPHISKRKTEAKILQIVLNALVSVLADCKTDEEVSAFLDSILTPTEKIMLAKRLGVVMMLDEGFEQTKIDETLKITRPTIEKLKLLSATRGKGYQVALNKLKKRQNWQEIKETLVKIANAIMDYRIKKPGYG